MDLERKSRGFSLLTFTKRRSVTAIVHSRHGCSTKFSLIMCSGLDGISLISFIDELRFMICTALKICTCTAKPSEQTNTLKACANNRVTFHLSGWEAHAEWLGFPGNILRLDLAI